MCFLGSSCHWTRTRDGWVRSANATSVLCRPYVCHKLHHLFDASFRCKLIWITLQWKFQWKINCPGTGIRTLALSMTELSVSPRIKRRWRKCRGTIFKGFWCFGSDGWSTKNFFWKKKKHPESLIFSDFESNRSSRVRNHKNTEYGSTKWLKWNVLGSSTGK